MGSPVYLLAALGAAWDAVVAIVEAALLACCAACGAACCSSACGRAGSVCPPYEASKNEGWVSSPGNAKRGDGMRKEFTERLLTRRGAAVV